MMGSGEIQGRKRRVIAVFAEDRRLSVAAIEAYGGHTRQDRLASAFPEQCPNGSICLDPQQRFLTRS